MADGSTGDTPAPKTLPGLVARRDALLQERADLARRMHEVTMALVAIGEEIFRITLPRQHADHAQRRHERDAVLAEWQRVQARADRDA